MIHDAKRTHLQGALLLVLGSVAGCVINTNPNNNGDSKFYHQTDLVADQAAKADFMDDNLVNPWGIAYGPDTYFWVANNGTSTSTLYAGNGAIENDAIGGPAELDAAPTGLVYNGTSGFQIESDGQVAPSQFLFATDDGKIFGWSADVDERHAVMAVDHSGDDSIYLGLAIATSGGTTRLYASDFYRRRIDVYEDDFSPADMPAEAFHDPALPDGYAPFSIHQVDGRLYVAYAKQNADGDEEVAGPGLGYVAAFESDGTFISTVANGDLLNAPWGVALAPASFGKFGGALLIGNFGDGRITAFDADDYSTLGQLESAKDVPVEIEGLWGLTFGNGRDAGQLDRLYFTAGTADETHGLFGSLGATVVQTGSGGGGY